jgi:hypothetical protein
MNRFLAGIVVCVSVGFGVPRLEVAYECLRPISEGCVWGHALIGVNTAATLVLIGVPVGAFVFWWLGARR